MDHLYDILTLIAALTSFITCCPLLIFIIFFNALNDIGLVFYTYRTIDRDQSQSFVLISFMKLIAMTFASVAAPHSFIKAIRKLRRLEHQAQRHINSNGHPGSPADT